MDPCLTYRGIVRNNSLVATRAQQPSRRGDRRAASLDDKARRSSPVKGFFPPGADPAPSHESVTEPAKLQMQNNVRRV
ncbi:hypothetical protein N7492_005099 [Penicillium capsulatum]|uniref:Uncharacterized protein n=1 Tax=Penicillium capsulatum TaxID=69766 RepID=A0A9W9I970_9EURO|nr:hypothetical protein N7492_005099 [Penicillium capsulatum]KAJ6135794.1 hypothetical protein N7512_000954 [Penicillium capsulatum]